MATYRASSHDRLRDRLVDASIGTVIGVQVAIVLWILTVWLVMG